jgi:hypothetical protein
MQKLTVKEVDRRLREHHGNAAAVGRSFGLSRQAVWSFCQRHPSLRDTLADCRESMKDHAESALFRATLAGEAWAVQFFLRTQARDRNYCERSEVRLGGVEDAPPLRLQTTPLPLSELPTELVEQILEFLTLKQAGKAAAANGAASPAVPPAPARAGGPREVPAAPPPPPADEGEELIWLPDGGDADAVGQAQEGEGGPGGR